MQSVLDMLTSGVHDAKNQLFIAESTIVRAEAEHGIELGEARFAIEQAALRLGRILTAYRCQRGLLGLAIEMVRVADLLAEAELINGAHCRTAGLTLTIDGDAPDLLWPLDRELMLDVLSNALQNAARFAKGRIHLTASHTPGGLVLRVEDDGPGFAETDVLAMTPSGLGLFVAQAIAQLHCRGEIRGALRLRNGGELGGAVFELTLP